MLLELIEESRFYVECAVLEVAATSLNYDKMKSAEVSASPEMMSD